MTKKTFFVIKTKPSLLEFWDGDKTAPFNGTKRQLLHIIVEDRRPPVLFLNPKCLFYFFDKFYTSVS